MELLRKVAGTLRFPGPGDDPVTFASEPTVTVTRHSDGSAMVEDATTTKVEGDEPDPFYTVDLTGEQLAEVELLVAEWTDGSSTYESYAEVVGGHVTSLKAIETKYDGSDKSAEDYAWAREAASTAIEAACGVAFRPRYARAVRDGTGTDTLMLPNPRLLRVLAASIDGDDIDLEELTVDPAGFLVRAGGVWTAGRANIAVAYVHGHEHFPPAALPVVELASYLLTEAPTDRHARATSFSTEQGTYSLVTAGMRGASFPLPNVNAFVQDHEYVSVG